MTPTKADNVSKIFNEIKTKQVNLLGETEQAIRIRKFLSAVY